jgi:adenylate cyclase class 2
MENSMDHLEVEVKFHLKDETDMQRRLLKLGTTQGPKVFESNTRFDDSQASLQTKGCLLRLRRDSTNRLTFKRKPANADREVKVFQELEVAIGDVETMAAILDAIGFHPAQIYEKWRQTYLLPDAEICIDTMPYGVFLEIESSKKRIKDIAAQLELSWEKRILDNYLSIFEIIKKNTQLPFRDVTFDNFASHPTTIEPYLSILEAGSK